MTSHGERPSPVRVVCVDADQAGQRLDNFLAACFRQVPKARLYRCVRKGEVRVNKGRVRQDYRLQEGDLVRLPPLTTPTPGAPVRPGAGLRQALREAILFEDDCLMVLNKPSGLAVHGGSGQALGLIEAMRDMHPDIRFLDLVHRLDRETSGCLILAKRRSTLTRLHAALRDGGVDKRYRTLLKGRWRGGGRRIDRALSRSSGRNGERMVRVDRAGRDSSTAFTPLATGELASLMEARPHTGRTHQIRVHAAALDMPVAGDPRYGDREFNTLMRTRHGLSRLFLHASSLRFEHPRDGSTVEVQAPLPDELERVVQALNLVSKTL